MRQDSTQNEKLPQQPDTPTWTVLMTVLALVVALAAVEYAGGHGGTTNVDDARTTFKVRDVPSNTSIPAQGVVSFSPG